MNNKYTLNSVGGYGIWDKSQDWIPSSFQNY